MGISPGSFGIGVTVIASTVFSGSNVPTPQTVTALLNTNGLQTLQVSGTYVHPFRVAISTNVSRECIVSIIAATCTEYRIFRNSSTRIISSIRRNSNAGSMGV